MTKKLIWFAIDSNSDEKLTIHTRLKDAGYIEVQQPHPDYLGAFTTGEVSLKQFYKWLDGKYMIRFGIMSPKINAMEPITYNIIFYNGAQTWGKFFDIQAIVSNNFISTIEEYAENMFNELKEKDNGRI